MDSEELNICQYGDHNNVDENDNLIIYEEEPNIEKLAAD